MKTDIYLQSNWLPNKINFSNSSVTRHHCESIEKMLKAAEEGSGDGKLTYKRMKIRFTHYFSLSES